MMLIPWCPKHDMQAIRCDRVNSHEPDDVIESKEVPNDFYEKEETDAK